MQDFEICVAKYKMLGVDNIKFPKTNITFVSSSTVVFDSFNSRGLETDIFSIGFRVFLDIVLNYLTEQMGVAEYYYLRFIYLKDDNGDLVYLAFYDKKLFNFKEITCGGSIIDITLSIVDDESTIYHSSYNFKTGTYISSGYFKSVNLDDVLNFEK